MLGLDILIKRLPWKTPRGPLSVLPKILGFTPRNYDLYELAFTHSSCSIELPDGTLANNERLEFLGDSVLATSVSHYLYTKYPKWDEGMMSKRRGALVKRAVNNKIAEEMGLANLIHTKHRIGNMSPDIFGNTLEALIGAIFLDRGYKVAENFVYQKFLKSFLEMAEELEDETTNYKSQLLEWVQKNHLEIEFEMLEEPRSSRGKFVCAAVINGKRIGIGSGYNKKEAHQDASHNALDGLTKASKAIKRKAAGAGSEPSDS